MIQVRGLTKVFPTGPKAVDELDLSVPEGEILGLLGPNGAGKTTTIRALSTLCGFDSGEVRVAGYDVDKDPEKVRQSIGVVAQNTGIDYFLTGRENLELQGHLYRMKKADIRTRIAELANYFELNDSLDRQVAGYSGGMRRKLDIATALIHHPKLVFLDEPTLGLDIKSRKMLWNYIEKLNKEMGITILLTTHYLEEADKLARRVAIISGGKIRAIGTPDELKSSIAGNALTLNLEQQDWAAQQFATALKQTDYVRDVLWEGKKLHLYVTNGAESVPKITELAGRHTVHILTLSLSRPSLDDVFLKYTGSSMDDSVEESGDEWWKQWAGKGGGGKWQKQWEQSSQGEEPGGEQTTAWQGSQGNPADQQQSAAAESSEPSGGGWPQQKWTQEEMEQWFKQHNNAAPDSGPSPASPSAADTAVQAEPRQSQWSADGMAHWQGGAQQGTADETKATAPRADASPNQANPWPSQQDWSGDEAKQWPGKPSK